MPAHSHNQEQHVSQVNHLHLCHINTTLVRVRKREGHNDIGVSYKKVGVSCCLIFLASKRNTHLQVLINKGWMLDQIKISLASFTAIKGFSGAESHGVGGSATLVGGWLWLPVIERTTANQKQSGAYLCRTPLFLPLCASDVSC